jgi:hypothetical protein
MALTTGPHGTIAECIEALEAEIARISDLLGSVKKEKSAEASDIAPV